MSDAEDTEHGPVRIFKLRTVEGTATSSSGRIELIEGRQPFREKLLRAAIYAEAQERTDHRADDLTQLRATGVRAWVSNILRPLAGVAPHETGRSEPQRLVGAWELVNGQWVELRWALSEPHILFRPQLVDGAVDGERVGP